MRNLIFVGLPGSGKSTVGRLCAKALNLPFVDADKFLEQREGRSVADIFASSGEGYFRDLESRVLAELCRREGIVLATGGGAVLRGRPLLTDDGAIFRLARQRRDLYRATAHHSVNKPTARQAAEEAVRLWREEQT